MRYEEELRLSPRYQKEMEEAENSPDSEWMDVAKRIQTRVCDEYGISIAELHALARTVQPPPFWIKYNRARDGELKEGDAVPNNISLFPPTYLHRTKPLVIFAGSIS